MKIHKNVVKGALAFLAASSLLGMGLAPAQAVDANTVTIWMDSDSQGALKNTVNTEAEKLGITITWVTKDFGAMKAAAITAIPAGNGPDILAGAHDWTGSLVAAGVLAPVSLGANASSFSAEAKSGFSLSGKQYGVPGWTENIALLYNKAKGTKAPTAAEFKAAIKAGKVEVGFDKQHGDPYHFSVFSSSFGLDQYVRKNGSWTHKIGVGGAGGAAYAKWLASKDGGKALKSGLGWDQLQGQLKDGTAKYWITGPWAVSDLTTKASTYKNAAGTNVTAQAITRANLGVASFPSVGGKPVHQFSGVRGYWQSVKVPGSANATAVGKVLTLLGGPVVQLASFTSDARTPANKVALSRVNDPITKAFGSAGAGAYPMPSFLWQGTTWSKIGDAEAGLMAGKGGSKPEAYWAKAINALQDLIDVS